MPEFLLEIGFEEQWFSDAIAFCCEKPGAAVVVNQYEGEGASMIIRGTDQRELDDLFGNPRLRRIADAIASAGRGGNGTMHRRT